MNTVTLTPDDVERVRIINERIRGWSSQAHYAFFKGVLADLPHIADVLVLGVYQGRDIAYILDIAARYHPSRALRIVGVDKFSDTPCADWPADKRVMDWHGAGFGDPPDLALARTNIAPFANGSCTVGLTACDDESFLGLTSAKFDWPHIDTSHDYATVRRQLKQIGKVCRENAIVSGDDYSDQGTWGVKQAVREVLGDRHGVFAEWIWYTERRNLP